MDKIQLKIIAERSISEILKALNINYSENGFMYSTQPVTYKSICPCIQHEGDRSSQSFSWSSSYGRWICWSHHCEELYGSDVFGLVRSVLNISFSDSMSFVGDVIEKGDLDVYSIPDNAISSKKLFIHKPIIENRLQFLKKDPQFLLERKYSKDIIREYEIGFWFYPGTFMHNRVIFPIRDHDGFLVGFTGRSINNQEPKWLHGRDYRNNSKDTLYTGSLLYNLFRAIPYIEKSKSVILVEGPLDGLRLEMFGIYNWVATLGISFGSKHRDLLIKHGVNKIYVAYDNDLNKSGDIGFDRVSKITSNYIDIEKINLLPGTDPGDLLEKQEVLSIFAKCI